MADSRFYEGFEKSSIYDLESMRASRDLMDDEAKLSILLANGRCLIFVSMRVLRSARGEYILSKARVGGVEWAIRGVLSRKEMEPRRRANDKKSARSAKKVLPSVQSSCIVPPHHVLGWRNW